METLIQLHPVAQIVAIIVMGICFIFTLGLIVAFVTNGEVNFLKIVNKK